MMCERFGYGPGSRVLEIGSNDGYLLKYFKEKGSYVIGFEPSSGPAQEAEKIGIQTYKMFFDSRAGSHIGATADLICGINVLAHQPDINDFVAGLKIALAPGGVVNMEFPHLMRLIDECQFDTVYHEHYSYFSFTTICKIFQKHGLEVFDVDEIPEHGGSLRIYARHDTGMAIWAGKVGRLMMTEAGRGMGKVEYYKDFQLRADTIKRDLVGFLVDRETWGLNTVAYGSAAKGNTLLNFCGIRADLIDFVVDRSPHKIGKFLPGSRIPVVSEEAIRELKPAYILILPWNLKNEIMEQLSYVREWGCKLVVAIPRLEVL
jgi:SAM-dependent methyltransferase